jgi:hypothetical protein
LAQVAQTVALKPVMAELGEQVRLIILRSLLLVVVVVHIMVQVGQADQDHLALVYLEVEVLEVRDMDQLVMGTVEVVVALLVTPVMVVMVVHITAHLD